MNSNYVFFNELIIFLYFFYVTDIFCPLNKNSDLTCQRLFVGWNFSRLSTIHNLLLWLI